MSWPIIPRMLAMYWEAKEAGRSPQQFRLSADMYARWERIKPEPHGLMGVLVVKDDALPPRGLVLE
jgi:hypothetical protein